MVCPCVIPLALFLLPFIPLLISSLFKSPWGQRYVDPTMIEWNKRGHGFNLIFWFLENPLAGLFFVLFIPTAITFFIVFWQGLSWYFLFLSLLPVDLMITGISCLVMGSRVHDNGPINKQYEDLIVFKDQSFQKKWKGKKIPIETAVEAYQDQKIDFKDVLKVFELRYELFRFCITCGHLKSLIKDLFSRLWVHTKDADKADVSDVYNRGNDFYGWFLCDRMLYSSGIFNSRDGDLEEAQTRKLNKICKMLQFKEGEEHLDLGCGWGALICHASTYFGVKSTGITLSQEQDRFISSKPKEMRQRVQVKVMNAWDIPSDKKYDKITCVEMSEHIGIRDYQKFQHFVRNLLKDDGIFYLQIAGLRRNWQWEDFIWGIFMNKYIFPGADASCPLAWDIEQLERAGWEIREVENNGVHYSITILRWYQNWIKNREKVVAKYGEWVWRNWVVFLAWSYLIAAQGSSTVYMMTMTKNFPNDKTSRKGIPENQKQPPIDRIGMFVKPKYVLD